MNLDSWQLHKSDKIHLHIKEALEEDAEFLRKTGVEVCPSCKGTGLSSYSRLNGTTSYCWEPGSYCGDCGSIGFIKLDKLFNMTKDGINFLCKKCYGIGCKNCNDGYVDWISHAKGR